MAESIEHPLARSERRSAARAGDAPPWPGAPRPGEGERDPSRDHPPTLAFAAGLAVWGLGLALVLARCAPIG